MLARGSLGNPWRFARLLGRYEGEPTAERGRERAETIIDAAEDHLGPERAGRYLRKFYPWYADTLGLTKREREPLVTAPTTAHARAALAALRARNRPCGLGPRCYTLASLRHAVRGGFSYAK